MLESWQLHGGEHALDDRELCFLPAHVMRRQLIAREYSARELMEAHIAQIERVNGTVNAFVTLRLEDALEDAEAADRRFEIGRAHV